MRRAEFYGCRLRASHYVIALLIFSTFATFRRRQIWDLFQPNGFDAEICFKIAVWLVLALIAVIQWRRIFQQGYLILQPPLSFYSSYLLVGIVSTAYSVDPILSLFRAGQFVIALALGLSVLDAIPSWPRLGAVYLGGNWIFLLIGFTGLIESLDWRALPDYQEQGFLLHHEPWRFGTPLGHFLVIADVAVMVGIAVAARIHDRIRIMDAMTLLWVLLTILLTVSREALMGFAVGLLIVLSFRGLLPLALLGGTGLVAGVLVAPGLLDLLLHFIYRGQDASQLESLSNRTDIWESAISHIDKHWLLGYGFRASRFLILDEQANGAGVAHAHNAVLESILGLGVVGGIVAALLLFAILGYAVGIVIDERKRRAPLAEQRGVEFLAMYPIIFISSMLDSSFALDINAVNLCLVAFLIDVTRHRVITQKSKKFPSASGTLGTTNREIST